VRLSDDDLVEAERRARRFSGAWTGTSGLLALYLVHAINEIREARMAHSTPAEELLATAAATIRQRRGTYGPPAEHFAKTVAAVNAIFSHKLREPLTVADWAQVMILDKLARHQGAARSADTPVDLAGYAACLAEVEAAS
jgi:hypothetical protein